MRGRLVLAALLALCATCRAGDGAGNAADSADGASGGGGQKTEVPAGQGGGGVAGVPEDKGDDPPPAGAPTRAPAGLSAAPAPAASAPAAEARNADAVAAGAQRNARASQNAARAAQSLKSSLSPGDGPLGPSRPGAASPRPGPDASAERNLLAAQASGYGAVFKDLGLSARLGPDGRVNVVDASGRPAAAAELDVLRARLATEPTALVQRPDFYRVIPRERFQELKGDYRGRQDLRDTTFKHMGLAPEDRDFQWSQSCQKLSGDCNRNETALHYSKGENVPPETLARAWETVHEPTDEGDDAATEPDDGADMARIRAHNRARSRERNDTGGFGAEAVAALRARFGRFLRSPSEEFDRRDASGARIEAGEAAPAGSDGASSSISRGGDGVLAGSRRPAPPPAVPPPSPGAGGSRRSWAAPLAAGAVLIVLALSRRGRAKTFVKGENS